MPSKNSRLGLLFLLTLRAVSAKENPAQVAARETFEKVETALGIPVAADVHACVEAQAAAEKVTPKSERPTLDTRHSYCAFLSAALAQDTAKLLEAAGALNAARGDGKNDSAPLLKIASAIAALKANAHAPAAAAALADLAQPLNCFSNGFAHTSTCNALGAAAYLWIGAAALERGEWAHAEQAFRHVDGSPWSDWLTGVYQQQSAHWRDAAFAYARAADSWPVRGQTLAAWLGPQLSPGDLPARLAFTRMMAGDAPLAGPALDAAIAARPDDSWSLFLRFRLRDALGDLEAAAKSASDPAHVRFYQAILAMRHREFPAATRDFDLALKGIADPVLRQDIPAWKLLTAAEAGECNADPDATEQSASSASPLFPKEELAAQLLDCRVRRAASLEQLSALDTRLRPSHFTQPGNEALHEHMAAAYNRLGVQAEDRKDTEAAIAAYRRALEWSPRNTKSRFNLGALYLGQNKFPQAEEEYRALLASDPADREAQFWLGQSILAAKPDAERKTEGCTLLQQSIKIQDSAKRDQFAMAFSTSLCAQ